MSDSPLLRSVDDNHQNIVDIYKNLPTFTSQKITLSVSPVCDEMQKLDDDFTKMFEERRNVDCARPETSLCNVPEGQVFNSLYLLIQQVSLLEWKIVRRENWLIRKFMSMSSQVAFAEQAPVCISNTIFVFAPLLLNPIVSQEKINVLVAFKKVAMGVELSIDATVEHLIHHCAVNFNVHTEDLTRCVLCIQGLCEILPSDAHLNELQHIQQCMRVSRDVNLELMVLNEALDKLTHHSANKGDSAQRRAERIRSPTDSKQDRLSDKVSIIVDSLKEEAFLFKDILLQLKTLDDASIYANCVGTEQRQRSTTGFDRGISRVSTHNYHMCELISRHVKKILLLLTNLTICVRFSSRELDISIDRLQFLSAQCGSGAPVAEATLSTLIDTFMLASQFLNSVFHSYFIERHSQFSQTDDQHVKTLVCPKPIQYLTDVKGFVIVEINSCFHESLKSDIEQLRHPENRKHSSSDRTLSSSSSQFPQTEQRFTYQITAELRHNCMTISPSKKTRWVSPSITASDDRLPLRITFNAQLSFSEVNACTLPRETLWKGKSESVRIGWACLGLFDAEQLDFVGNLCGNDGNERINELYLGLHPAQDLDCSGGSCYNVLCEKCPVVSLAVSLSTLESMSKRIRFPDVVARSDILLFDFQSLPHDLKTKLRDILRLCNFSHLDEDKRQLIWEKRHYLTNFSGALPKVLRSICHWDCLSLQDTYKLLKEWRHLSPAESIELLLPQFSDQHVRLFAVQSLRTLPTDSLELYLPQLVRAWAYDFNPCSPLAELLLSSATRSPTFAHALFWQLKLWLSLYNDPWLFRYLLLAQAMYVVSPPIMIEEFKRQNSLVVQLNQLSSTVKQDQSLLNVEAEKVSEKLKISHVRLPLKFSFMATAIDPNKCHVYNSMRAPVQISFVHNPLTKLDAFESRTGQETLKIYNAIYKIGDDITQDIVKTIDTDWFFLQLIRIMDLIWQSEGLDLRLLLFNCVQTGEKRGIIEVVEDAVSLREIQTRYGLTGSFKTRALDDWLAINNPNSVDYSRAVQNFSLSCAAYCVATFVLGVGDRHNDNILLRKSGHLLHIDFGKYLGDVECFGSFKRDRTAFVFTADMAYVIYGKKQSSKRYQSFLGTCVRAFNLLRRNSNVLLTLLVMLQDTGIAGIHANGVQFVKDVLLPDETDEEASKRFASFLETSLRSRWTQINFFIHNVAQYTPKRSNHDIGGKSFGKDKPRKEELNNLSSSLSNIKFSLESTDIDCDPVTVLPTSRFKTPPTKSHSFFVDTIAKKWPLGIKVHSLCRICYECLPPIALYREQPDLFKLSVKFDSSPLIFLFRSYGEMFELSTKLYTQIKSVKLTPIPSNYCVLDVKNSPFCTMTGIHQIRAVFEFVRSVSQNMDKLSDCKQLHKFIQHSEHDAAILAGENIIELFIIRDDGCIVAKDEVIHSQTSHIAIKSSPLQTRPKIKISFSYSNDALHILVMYGRNLERAYGAFPSTFVKVSIGSRSNRSSTVGQHTRTVLRASNPSYYDLFIYRIAFDKAIGVQLKLQVYNADFRVSDSLLFSGTSDCLHQLREDGSSVLAWVWLTPGQQMKLTANSFL